MRTFNGGHADVLFGSDVLDDGFQDYRSDRSHDLTAFVAPELDDLALLIRDDTPAALAGFVMRDDRESARQRLHELNLPHQDGRAKVPPGCRLMAHCPCAGFPRQEATPTATQGRISTRPSPTTFSLYVYCAMRRLISSRDRSPGGALKSSSVLGSGRLRLDGRIVEPAVRCSGQCLKSGEGRNRRPRIRKVGGYRVSHAVTAASELLKWDV